MSLLRALSAAALTAFIISAFLRVFSAAPDHMSYILDGTQSSRSHTACLILIIIIIIMITIVIIINNYQVS